MNVYTAVCVKDWSIQAENGDRQECKSGQRYTISEIRKDDTLTVFSTFWVPAPKDIFDLNTMRRL